MKFLNGYKTVTGLVGILATVLVANGGHLGQIGATIGGLTQHTDSIVAGVFGALSVLGIIHKVEKAKE